MPSARVLFIGFGNPGRRDDGLGPACAAAVEKLEIPGVTVDSDYQLSVEHADALARHDVVIFADAALDGPEPFAFRRIEPGPAVMFSSHSVTPEGVLTLTDELFHEQPEAYVLGVRGYEFDEFGEALSARAQANLAAALEFITPVLRERDFGRHASTPRRGGFPPCISEAVCESPLPPAGGCTLPALDEADSGNRPSQPPSKGTKP